MNVSGATVWEDRNLLSGRGFIVLTSTSALTFNVLNYSVDEILKKLFRIVSSSYWSPLLHSIWDISSVWESFRANEWISRKWGYKFGVTVWENPVIRSNSCFDVLKSSTIVTSNALFIVANLWTRVLFSYFFWFKSFYLKGNNENSKITKSFQKYVYCTFEN